MYLTIAHPEVVAELAGWGGGLWAMPLGLVVKVPKEYILTARINQEFAFYVAPVQVGATDASVLITAFFDDDDEPLTCRTPLVENDGASVALIALLTSETFNVFFFSELNRELLSVRVAGGAPAVRAQITQRALMPLASVREALDQAEFWFSHRGPDIDRLAVPMHIEEELFPSDLFVMDIDIGRHQFRGGKSFSSTTLQREEPGAYQEQDIVFLLQRVFPQEKIYLNPIKDIDGEELVDILILGNICAYLVQAKDSPNTERILRNTISRKRTKAITQVKGASDQLKGAFSFIDRNPKFHLRLDGGLEEIDLTGKPLLGVIVVKELFNDSMRDYSATVFDLMNDVQWNCIAFDYPELGLMTLHCPSEEHFLGAAAQILEGAAEHGELPRLRYSGRPKSRGTE